MKSLSDIAERAKSDDVLDRLLECLGDRSSGLPCAEIYVPGRIELLGKHTDYAGGSSLTFATSRGFRALAVPDDRQDNRPDDQPGLSISGDDTSGEVFIPWNEEGASAADEPEWSVYPRAVVRRLIRHFGVPEIGVRVVFTSDLPQAAGMSSSSALLTTVALAILCTTRMSASPVFRAAISCREDLAEFLGAVEAGTDYGELKGDAGVGTRGGAQDHAAILCSEPGRIGLVSYLPARVLEYIEFPDDMCFVVCHSGVDARKVDGAKEEYNTLSDLAVRVGEAWARSAANVDASATDRGTLAATIADPDLDEASVIDVIDSIARDPEDRRRLWHRFAQFHDECTIVLPAAVKALREADWATLSEAAATSQWMAEDWLENQVEHTAYLVRSARAFDAPAASAFGAGFGGAVWALVPTASAERFASRWMANFRREYPDQAESARVFVERPSAPATWPVGAVEGVDVPEKAEQS